MINRAELWHQIVENLDAGIVVLDADLTVIYWNPWMVQSSGVAGRDVVGRPLGEAFPRLAETGVLDRLRDVVALGVRAVFSHAFHSALFPTGCAEPESRVPKYQEVTCVPLMAEGRVEGAALLVYDVTALVVREFALTEAARQLRALRDEMAAVREEMSLKAPSLDKILELLEARR
ncbi:PAS domain-containing protein [Deferrisoma palaeochoriense]